MELVKFVLILTLLVSAVSNLENKSDAFENGQEQCWQKSNKCRIRVEIRLDTGNTLPLDINCTQLSDIEDSFPKVQYEGNNSIFFQKYENIRNISLNGCYSSLQTFGLEYVPNYVNLSEVIFKNFQINEISPAALAGTRTIKKVSFRNNLIEGVLKNSFESLVFIENLYFEANGLKNVESKAFNSLLALKVLVLLESDLVIADSDVLFLDTGLQALTLSVKTIGKEVLKQLPDSLEFLNITRTGFVGNDAVVVNPLKLKEIHITYNDITTFTLTDKKTLISLNLSSNNLNDVLLNNCTNLKYLDLSHNSIERLQEESFLGMEHLEKLYLQENRLKILSMDIFKQTEVALRFVDLSGNLLQSILIGDKFVPNPQVTISVNKNPWHCRWLLELLDKRPEQYRMFRYEKNFRRINLNGLECVSYTNITLISEKTTPVPTNWNLTAYAYNPPMETKKIQRTEALIVVLFLFIGVGFLSFLLYLWIKCQKMFHLSFYRSLPRKRSDDDDFDVVRQMPGLSAYESHLPCSNGNLHIKNINLSHEHESIPICSKIKEECLHHAKLKNSRDV